MLKCQLFHAAYLRREPPLNQIKVLGLSLVTAIGAIATISEPTQAEVLCSVQQVINLEVIQGQPQWAATARQRVAGAVWQFNDNGTFVYAPANARTDLYPLQGTYQIEGDIIQFRGLNNSRTTVSISSAEIVGQVDTSQNQPVLSMAWAASNNVAATVNNTLFSSSTAAIYRAAMLLSC